MKRTILVISAAAIVLLPILRAGAPAGGAADGLNRKQASPKVFYCPQAEGTKASCPVDGRMVAVAKDTPSSNFPCCGIFLYFCSEACREEFHANNQTKSYLGDTLMTPPKAFDCPRNEGHQAICPVMGNKFAITKETLHSVVDGKFVYFCCPACKPVFDKNPIKYLD